MTTDWLDKSRDAWENTEDLFNVLFSRNKIRSFLQSQEFTIVLSNIPDQKLLILDAGCGPGRFSTVLIDKGHDVISYDFSYKILKNLKENFICNINPIQGYIHQLTLKDKSFDTVLLIDVLHHLENKEMRLDAIKEAFRVSKGDVILDIKNAYNPFIWFKYRRIHDPYLRKSYSFKEIHASIFQSGGFILKVYPLGFPIKSIAPYIIVIASSGER